MKPPSQSCPSLQVSRRQHQLGQARRLQLRSWHSSWPSCFQIWQRPRTSLQGSMLRRNFRRYWYDLMLSQGADVLVIWWAYTELFSTCHSICCYSHSWIVTIQCELLASRQCSMPLKGAQPVWHAVSSVWEVQVPGLQAMDIDAAYANKQPEPMDNNKSYMGLYAFPELNFQPPKYYVGREAYGSQTKRSILYAPRVAERPDFMALDTTSDWAQPTHSPKKRLSILVWTQGWNLRLSSLSVWIRAHENLASPNQPCFFAYFIVVGPINCSKASSFVALHTAHSHANS